jgi:hypothetical protein
MRELPMEGHFDTHKIIAAAAKPTRLNWPMHRISSICCDQTG